MESIKKKIKDQLFEKLSEKSLDFLCKKTLKTFNLETIIHHGENKASRSRKFREAS